MSLISLQLKIIHAIIYKQSNKNFYSKNNKQLLNNIRIIKYKTFLKISIKIIKLRNLMINKTTN